MPAPSAARRSSSRTTRTSRSLSPIGRSCSARSRSLSRAALLVAGTSAFAAAVWAALDRSHDGLSLLLVAFALLAVGVVWLDRGPDTAKELALIATLGATAAAGRVLFAAIPGVQPVTVMTVVAGVALGARAGFAVGATAAFVSNFFLGQGVWTPWQMLAWGAGVVASLAASSPAQYVLSHQQTDGGFAETGGTESPELTAWAALGLRAAGAGSGGALSYLLAHEPELKMPTSIALVAMAKTALGRE